MGHKTVDVSELESFFNRLEKAAKGDFRKELEKFLVSLGDEFLRILEDEIIRKEVMDTRELLNSFHKGNESNIWELNEGNLSLEVGSNLEYAAYVNNGHTTVNEDTKGAFRLKDGTLARFIPGKVVLDSNGKIIDFTYDPSAKTGMTLKQKDVKGVHYWESALNILEKMMPKILEVKMQQWIEHYFKDLSNSAHDFYK